MVFFFHVAIIVLQGKDNSILKNRIKNCDSEKNIFENHYNISTLKYNVLALMERDDFTLRELSEKADISYDTLKTFLYNDTRDCKLSTVVHLAKAFQVTIDELVGAGTIDPITEESIMLTRKLPSNALYLVRWFIRHQISIYSDIPKKKKVISVMSTECGPNGNIRVSNEIQSLDITDFDKDIRSKVFIGLRIPDDRYMSTYSPFDTLLIANDRKGSFREHIIIIIDKSLYIAKRKEVSEDSKKMAKFYSIRDGRFLINENDVDEVIGYVAAVHTSDT